MNYFTADLHLNHYNIIEFCNRPFKDVNHMNNQLIDNINAKCKYQDTLYHLGDFCFTGRRNGKTKPLEFEDRINCKVIHVLGNHDRNNHLKNSIRYAEIHFSNTKWLLQHKPPVEGQIRTFSNDTDTPFIYLVGHVHENWKHKFVENQLVINMGVDVWNYYPVEQQEITVYAERNITEGEK